MSSNAKHSHELLFFFKLAAIFCLFQNVYIAQTIFRAVCEFKKALIKNSQILQFNVYVSFDQMSAEKEMKDSDRLFTSLIRTAEERRVEVNTEIMAKQKFAELRSEELIKELQKEIAELQWRNTELAELTGSEDHLHLLQVQSHAKKKKLDSCTAECSSLKIISLPTTSVSCRGHPV